MKYKQQWPKEIIKIMRYNHRAGEGSLVLGLYHRGSACATSAKARELLLAEHVHPNRLTPFPNSCHSLMKRKCRKELTWPFSASQPAHPQTQWEPAPLRWAKQGTAWHRGPVFPSGPSVMASYWPYYSFLGFWFHPYHFFRMSAPQSCPLNDV